MSIKPLRQLKAHITISMATPIRNVPDFRVRLRNEMLLRMGNHVEAFTQWVLALI